MGIKDKIRTFGVLMILKAVYRHMLRALILKAIDDPDEDWDDAAMDIMDRLFDYEE